MGASNSFKLELSMFSVPENDVLVPDVQVKVMLENLGFTDEDEIWELVDDDKVFDVKDIPRDAFHIPRSSFSHYSRVVRFKF